MLRRSSNQHLEILERNINVKELDLYVTVIIYRSWGFRKVHGGWKYRHCFEYSIVTSRTKDFWKAHNELVIWIEIWNLTSLIMTSCVKSNKLYSSIDTTVFNSTMGKIYTIFHFISKIIEFGQDKASQCDFLYSGRSGAFWELFSHKF